MKYLIIGVLLLLTACDNMVSMPYGMAVSRDTVQFVKPPQEPTTYDSGASQIQAPPPPQEP